MTMTLERRLSSPLATTFPRLARDRAVRAGTLLRFNSGKAVGNPNATGALAARAVFPNLADAGYGDGVVAGTGLTNNAMLSGVTMANATSGAPNSITYGWIATASITGTTMTVSALTTLGSGATGYIRPGDTITSGAAAGTTIISQLTGTTGGTGTYQVSISQTVASTTIASGYDQHTANPDFMASCLVKLLSTANGSSTYRTIFALGTTTTNLFLFDTGADNKTPRCTATSTAGVPITQLFTGFTTDAIHHLALTREGAVGKVWLNGTQVGTFTTNATLPDLSGSALMLFDQRMGGTGYVATLENITATAAWRTANGRGAWTAAAAVAASYAADMAMGFS